MVDWKLGKLAFLLATLAVAAGPDAIHALQLADSTCVVSSAPGAHETFALPRGHTLEIARSNDTLDVAEACAARVTSEGGRELFGGEGFGAKLHGWTGRDVDADGFPDAIVWVDTGGGNRCCWNYTVFAFAPDTTRVTPLDFVPTFHLDGSGTTWLIEIVPFYDLGPSMVESPTVTRVHRFRDGRLVDATLERCPELLSDDPGDLLPRTWKKAWPSDAERGASRQASEPVSYEVSSTRVNAISRVLQHYACGRSDAVAGLVAEIWPTADRQAVIERLREAARRILPTEGAR